MQYTSAHADAAIHILEQYIAASKPAPYDDHLTLLAKETGEIPSFKQLSTTHSDATRLAEELSVRLTELREQKSRGWK